MKKRLLVMMVSLLLYGCTYPTLDKAIEKSIPYDVHDVVLIEEVGATSIVLYETNANKDNFPQIDEPVIALAIFKGSDQDGWKNVGPNGWTHNDSDSFTMYREFYYERDAQGEVTEYIPIYYGKLNNPNITQIITIDEDGHEKEAVLSEGSGGRYYVAFWDFMGLKGISKDGEIIDQMKWE